LRAAKFPTEGAFLPLVGMALPRSAKVLLGHPAGGKQSETNAQSGFVEAKFRGFGQSLRAVIKSCKDKTEIRKEQV
jgi:hypothetical protein